MDDFADGAETLATLLEHSGWEVRIARNGPAGLELARTWQPELVLLDIGLPEMDGYEVARRLRADPDTAHMVLVALTGWVDEDDERRSKEAGFDLHLTKPIEFELVTKRLARLPALRTAR